MEIAGIASDRKSTPVPDFSKGHNKEISAKVENPNVFDEQVFPFILNNGLCNEVLIELVDAKSVLGQECLTDGIISYLTVKLINQVKDNDFKNKSFHFLPPTFWSLWSRNDQEACAQLISHQIPHGVSENFMVLIPICQSGHWIASGFFCNKGKIRVFLYNSKKVPFEANSKICAELIRFTIIYLKTDKEVKFNIIPGPVQKEGDDFNCGLYMIEFYRRFTESFAKTDFERGIWVDANGKMVSDIILNRKTIILDILRDIKLPSSEFSVNVCLDNESHPNASPELTKTSSNQTANSYLKRKTNENGDSNLLKKHKPNTLHLPPNCAPLPNDSFQSSLDQSQTQSEMNLHSSSKSIKRASVPKSGQSSLLKSTCLNKTKDRPVNRTLFTPPNTNTKERHVLMISPLEEIKIFSPSKLNTEHIEETKFTNKLIFNILEHILDEKSDFNKDSFLALIERSFLIPATSYFSTTFNLWFHKKYIVEFMLCYKKGIISIEEEWEKIYLIRASLKISKLEQELEEIKIVKPIIPVKSCKVLSKDSHFFLGKCLNKSEIGLYSKIASRFIEKGFKSNTQCGITVLKKRANIVFDTICVLSNNSEDEELVPLLAAMMVKRPSLFVLACKQSKCKELKFPSKFSPAETSTFFNQTAGTKYNMLNMRRSIGPLFATVAETKKYEYEATSYVSNPANVEHGYISLQTLKKITLPDGRKKDKIEVAPHAYVKVISMAGYMEYILDMFVKYRNFDFEGEEFIVNWKGKIIIVVSGDSGGGSMKYFIQILDGHIHPYGLYMGSDTAYNQNTFHSMYYGQFKKLLDDGIWFRGKHYMFTLKVKGDMKQGYIALGISGASSTYPNKQDLMNHNHFKTHIDGSPHGPDYCFRENNDDNFNGKLKERTMDGIYRNYEANTLQYGTGNTNKDLKSYECVKAYPLFPLKSPKDVVPAELHAKLTLTKVGVDGGRDAVDGDDYDKEKQASRKKFERKIVETREDLDRFKEQQESHLRLTQKKRFLVDRLRVSGNRRLIENVVIKNHKSSKVQHKFFDKVKCSESCILTRFDSHLSWHECDSCRKKFHMYCLAITEAEELLINNNDPILCLKCKPRTLQLDVHIAELDLRNAKSGDFDVAVQRKASELLNLKNQVEFYTSDKVKEYDQQLKFMGVDIQVHFGGAITGNHCDKILHNYQNLVNLLPLEKQLLYTAYYECINEICSKISKKVWWSASEIDDFEKIIKKFGELFPKIIKTGMTPKAHEIIFHLIPFLRENGTWAFWRGGH